MRCLENATFGLSDEQRAVLETAARYAREVIRPRAAHYDRSGEMPLAELEQAWQLGLFASGIPEAYAGLGLSLHDQTLIGECVAWGCSGFWGAWAATDLAIDALAHFGSSEQKSKALPRLTSSFRLASFALSEASGGSDVAGLTTRAEKRGSSYAIRGAKQWITNAGFADFFVVFASTDSSARQRGLSAFLVFPDDPGIVIGSKEGKLGTRCSDTRAVHFDDCVVAADRLLGQEGDGFRIAASALLHGRIKAAAAATGVAQAAMELSVLYAMERKTAGKPIASHQAVQLTLARMAEGISAARAMTRRAAHMVDAGLRAEAESCAAKAFASDLAMRVATDAVQLHGGYGISTELPVEKLFRDAKVLQIIEGTNDVQRLIVAASLVAQMARA